LRCICTTNVAVEKQQVLHIVTVCVYVCVCDLSYPVCNVRAPYCHMWPAQLYNIFPHLFHKWHKFWGKKNYWHKMCVLISSTTFVGNISHSKKNWMRYDPKYLVSFMSSTHYSSWFQTFAMFWMLYAFFWVIPQH